MTGGVTYSEQRLVEIEDFFEHALIGLHIVGADGTIKRANKAEMALLGYQARPKDYIGHHISKFHVDQTVIDDMLQRLVNNEPLINYEARLATRDGQIRTVVIYSNSRMHGDTFLNTRCFSRPSVEDVVLRPEGGEDATALLAEQLTALPEDEKRRRFEELNDFFEHAPIGLHIVAPTGMVTRANRAELEMLGYGETPEEYIGHHIAEFHADPEVIDDMLERLLNNQPLTSHPGRLRARDGSIRSATIYSNSRFLDGKFVNTRCFTYPAVHEAASKATRFSWPSTDA